MCEIESLRYSSGRKTKTHRTRTTKIYTHTHSRIGNNKYCVGSVNGMRRRRDREQTAAAAVDGDRAVAIVDSKTVET